MQGYNSSAVVESCYREFSDKDKRAREIVAALDDFAATKRGQYAVGNILLCAGKDENTRETFREEALKYVKKYEFGGVFGGIAFMILRWLVIAIINHYIDEMISHAEYEG